MECCNQERTYMRFYGLLAQRFCALNKKYQELFDDCFKQQYSTIHRLETNKLRNTAKFFSHLLHTDAISWSVLGMIFFISVGGFSVVVKFWSGVDFWF